jgi:hypothetical protein
MHGSLPVPTYGCPTAPRHSRPHVESYYASGAGRGGVRVVGRTAPARHQPADSTILARILGNTGRGGCMALGAAAIGSVD